MKEAATLAGVKSAARKDPPCRKRKGAGRIAARPKGTEFLVIRWEGHTNAIVVTDIMVHLHGSVVLLGNNGTL